MSYAKPSITLAELWERTSQHGNTYFAGFWGHLSVALLFAGERPHPTRPGEVVKVWRLVAQEQERREGVPKPPASPPERVEAPAREMDLQLPLRVLTAPGGGGGRAARRGKRGWPTRWPPPTGSRAIRPMRSRSDFPP
jgi:hypothetical protein